MTAMWLLLFIYLFIIFVIFEVPNSAAADISEGLAVAITKKEKNSEYSTG